MITHLPARLARPAAALMLTAGLALVGTAIAPAAHAQSSTTCTGSSVITYSPGLTNTAQTVTYTEADTLWVPKIVSWLLTCNVTARPTVGHEPSLSASKPHLRGDPVPRWPIS